MAKKLYSKTNTDFVTRIMGVLESFKHKGKPYLAYLQSRERNDEFLMRDNLVKPLFQALGYDQQQDFSPEERIVSGIIDTTIRNGYNHPIIVIETQSSLLEDLTKHRNRLFSYTEDIGARFAILTDGVRFEAWECPGRGKARFLRVSLNFQELYSKFLKKGVEGLSELDVEKVLKLKFLSKELLFVREEELYEEPELHVSDPNIFSQLIDDLQGAMELVKSDIISQFEVRQKEWQGYQDLIAKAKTERVYPSEFKKHEPAKHAIECYSKWQKVSPGANSGSQELFCTETMYILFNRLLLIRICEDKGLTPRQISNGGIKTWLSWKGFMEFKKANYAELLRAAYETMSRVYPHLFRPGIFDWYLPDSDIVLRILFIFNRYNFRNVDRDVLGKLYEKYLDKEERKRLGQFYTPEEVIDYILEAVGYIPENEIEGKKLLDPACGSGGFLVRAVKALVERYQRRNVPTEIILNRVRDSIYGFDINPFAAHLAEMNLLFQVIDLINEAKKVNPDFNMEKFNIFVTDSLRMPKVGEQGQLSLEESSEYLEEAEIVKQIKLKQGDFSQGFNFVVGNPPYVRTESITPDYKKRLAQDFKHVYEGRFDLYIFFIGLGIDMLSEGGMLGYIAPGKFLVTENGGMLRRYILRSCSIHEIVDISRTEVFKEIGNYPVMVLLQEEKDAQARDNTQIKINELLIDSIGALPTLRRGVEQGAEDIYRTYHVRQGRFASNFDSVFDISSSEEVYDLRIKIEQGCTRLGQICEVHQGIITGRKKPENTARRRNIISADDLAYLSQERASLCKKVIDGKNMPGPYCIHWQGEYLIYAPKELTAPRETRWFETEKLVIQKIATRLTATYDEERFYCLDTLYVCLLKDFSYSLKYLLALLNSRLMDFYYSSVFSMVHIGGNYLEYRTRYLNNLPIKPSPAETQEELSCFVDQMLEINRKLPELEKLAINLPELIRIYNIQTKDLADCPEATLVMEKEVMGKPNIKREQTKVLLDRKSYIKCTDENLAEYLELYLNSIKDKLQGRTKTDLHRLLQVPKTAEDVKAILTKQETLLEEIDNLKQRRDSIDSEIDQKVCQLYGIELGE